MHSRLLLPVRVTRRIMQLRLVNGYVRFKHRLKAHILFD